VIARMVPAHVMVMTQPPMQGAPDGYITVMWPAVAAIRLPSTQVYTRQLIGWLALGAIVLLFGGLTYSQRSRVHAPSSRGRAV
jgi:hypothetical protein